MVQRAIACRSNGQSTRLGFGQSNELGHIVSRQTWIGHQHVACFGQGGYRLKIFDRIEAGFGVQKGVDDLRAVGIHQQGIAVVLGFGGVGGPHVTPCPRSVFNHHRLTPLLSELLCHHTGNRIIGASSCLRHHQSDLPRWKLFLGMRKTCDGKQNCQGAADEVFGMKCHVCFSFID